MISPVDVVVTAYQPPRWDLTLKGLELNQGIISRLIVVVDGDYKIAPSKLIPTFIYNLPKVDGFGVCRSMNYGIERVATPFFAHIDDDIILREEALALLLTYAKEETIISGYVDMVYEEKDLDLSPQTKFYKVIQTKPNSMPYHAICGAFFAADSACAKNVRWDESMTKYGFQDYDWAKQWMLVYENAPRIGHIRSYHWGATKNEKDRI